jgi:hypothetical protein
VNTVLTARPKLPAEADALEARFGLKVTARLEGGAQALPHDISERLRVARLQAVAQARQAGAAARAARPQAQASTVSVLTSRSGAAAALLGGPGGDESVWWGRLGWLLPTLVLAAGLLGLGEWQLVEQISATAQIDAELLGDDLPPSAYADEGFNAFLKTPPEVAPPAPEIAAEPEHAAETPGAHLPLPPAAH